MMTDGFAADTAERQYMVPFAPALVSAQTRDGAAGPAAGGVLTSPFAEALAVDGEDAQATDALEALLAEFEDEEFETALEGLADEAAARHWRTAPAWSAEAPVPLRDVTPARAWLAEVASSADRLLGDLETHFGDRGAADVTEAEIDAVAGRDPAVGEPVDAQDQFLGALVNKVKKVAKGVTAVAKKGLALAGKFLPMAVLMRALRRLVPSLLNNVLQRAIGRLPAPLRPIATRLAGRFAGAGSAASAPAETAPDVLESEEFDRGVAEALLEGGDAPGDPLSAAPAESIAEARVDPGPTHDLDVARARLVADLVDATPDEPPTAQLERFLPAVMAALPAIRVGIRVVGRDRVVAIVARALANLIRGMVGAQAAQALSRHIASVGLQMIGLEAESSGEPPTGGALGMEALVGAAEDTVREVASLPSEMLADDLLVEAEVQDAFARAVSRHLPNAVLRRELAERETPDDDATWMLMPRATQPCFRYKKYGRIVPVRINRPAARWVRLPGGDSLEDRLLDAGVAAWPALGELELFELLPGARLGHIAAYEADPGQGVLAAAEALEALDETAAAVLAGNPNLATGGAGTGGRYYRLRVGGVPLRRRRIFALRLDLTLNRPVLNVHIRVSERGAHALAAHLDGRRMAQVASRMRALTGPAFRQALAGRLVPMLGRRGLTIAADAAGRLADRLADAMVSAVAKQLPAIGTALAQAAKDPAPGITLTYGFPFASRTALVAAEPGAPTLGIRPGQHRG